MMNALTKEEIVKILKDALKDKEIVEEIEKIFIHKFVSNKEIKAILIELKEQREENNKRFEEINKRFEKLIEENNKRFEEINKRFEELREENNKRFEEINKRFEKLIEENNKRFEEINKRFEEVDRRFEELSKLIHRGFTALGARWGIYSEEAFREAMQGILEELGFYKVEKWKEYDAEGYVFDRPSLIEVDVVIKNEKHYLIEVKSSVSEGDVLKFKRIGEFYKKKNGVDPILVIVSPFISEKAIEQCEVFKIKYYTKM